MAKIVKEKKPKAVKEKNHMEEQLTNVEVPAFTPTGIEARGPILDLIKKEDDNPQTKIPVPESEKFPAEVTKEIEEHQIDLYVKRAKFLVEKRPEGCNPVNRDQLLHLLQKCLTIIERGL